MNESEGARGPKMGGNPVLRVLVKANDDVLVTVMPTVDQRAAGRSGLRDLVRATYGDAYDVDITHEAGSSSTQVLADLRAGGGSTGLLNESTDVVVLSVTSDLDTPADRYLADMEEILSVLRDRTEARVFLFNCSSLDPDAVTSNYHGIADPPSLRVHALNLAALRLSVTHGISIVDADRVIAELGGDRHVEHLGVYSAVAHEALCTELVRIIADYGFFEHRSLVPQLGRQRGNS